MTANTPQRVDVERLSPPCGAIGWIDQIDRGVMAMKGRPLSGKQRSAVLGVLLTLDPESPFYSPRYANAALLQQVAALEAERAEIVKKLGCHPGCLMAQIDATISLADERPNVDDYRQLQSKLAERDAEIETLRTALDLTTAAAESRRERYQAAERAREGACGLLRVVLERDGGKACACISHSRKAEREYESGTCPHQLGAAFLAANGGSHA